MSRTRLEEMARQHIKGLNYVASYVLADNCYQAGARAVLEEMEQHYFIGFLDHEERIVREAIRQFRQHLTAPDSGEKEGE